MVSIPEEGPFFPLHLQVGIFTLPIPINPFNFSNSAHSNRVPSYKKDPPCNQVSCPSCFVLRRLGWPAKHAPDDHLKFNLAGSTVDAAYKEREGKKGEIFFRGFEQSGEAKIRYCRSSCPSFFLSAHSAALYQSLSGVANAESGLIRKGNIDSSATTRKEDKRGSLFFVSPHFGHRQDPAQV